MTHWYVGQKCVCIDDDWTSINGENTPVKDAIYTIENIIEGHFPQVGMFGFQLFEITNAPRRYWGGFCECSFISTSFRPLTKTNIEIFEKLLRKKPRKKYAPTYKQVRETV